MLTAEVRRGRTFIVWLIVLNCLLMVITLAAMVAMDRWDRLPRFLGQVVGTIGTSYGLWTGSRFAKWLWVFGLVVIGAVCLYLPVVQPGTFSYSYMGPISVPFLLAGVHLAFGRGVQAFLRQQRGEEIVVWAEADDDKEPHWQHLD